MNIWPFQVYDPYLSFNQNERGFRERQFYDRKSQPSLRSATEADSTLTIWQLGRQAYDLVAILYGKAPSTAEIIEIGRRCCAIEAQLVDLLQTLIDDGSLIFTTASESDPIKDLLSVARDSNLGWMSLGFTTLIRSHPEVQPTHDTLEELELVLATAAIFCVDDCLITRLLSADFEAYFSELHSYLSLADSIRDRLSLPQEALKANARKGAEAKLAKDPKQRDKIKAKALWLDWQAGRTIHKSGAAFYRHVINSTSIESEKTVERWVAEWKTESKE